jgi:hypothetical protein
MSTIPDTWHEGEEVGYWEGAPVVGARLSVGDSVGLCEVGDVGAMEGDEVVGVVEGVELEGAVVGKDAVGAVVGTSVKLTQRNRWEYRSINVSYVAW